jgi:creatinine amidohydrolase
MPKWYELTQPAFSKLAGQTSVAVLITGAVEAHGTHLPLGTDTLLPTYLGDQIAERTKALVLPPIPFGDSWIFVPFKGTITVTPNVLTNYYADVMESVFNIGFRYIVVLNGHGGNVCSIRQAATIATSKKEASVILVNWWADLAKDARQEVLETPEGHAAEDETSEALYVCSNLVDMTNLVSSGVKTKFTIISEMYREKLIPSAVAGDPKTANEEKGKAIMLAAAEELVELIEQLERGEVPIEKD